MVGYLKNERGSIEPYVDGRTCESENSITTDLPYRVCLVNNSCKDHLDKERRGQQDLVVDQDQQYKITLKIEGAFPDP